MAVGDDAKGADERREIFLLSEAAGGEDKFARDFVGGFTGGGSVVDDGDVVDMVKVLEIVGDSLGDSDPVIGVGNGEAQSLPLKSAGGSVAILGQDIVNSHDCLVLGTEAFIEADVDSGHDTFGDDNIGI